MRAAFVVFLVYLTAVVVGLGYFISIGILRR